MFLRPLQLVWHTAEAWDSLLDRGLYDTSISTGLHVLGRLRLEISNILDKNQNNLLLASL